VREAGERTGKNSLEPWTLTPGLDETSRWAFIVGAPRCGTTALAEYLREHPDVCFSTPKEPHYFLMHDLRGAEPAQLRQAIRDRYLGLYFRERQGASVYAEGSVSYLFAPERLEPILKLWPRAKFIISLRSPLEMVPSLHQRLFYNGDENQRDFNVAWDLTEQRRAGPGVVVSVGRRDEGHWCEEHRRRAHADVADALRSARAAVANCERVLVFGSFHTVAAALKAP